MSFSVEKLQHDPVILVTLHEDYNVEKEMPNCIKEVLRLMEVITEPHYHILVFEAHLSLHQIMIGTEMEAKGPVSMAKHPMVKGIIWVTTDQMLELTAESLNSQAFGRREVPVFPTLDDALDYVRSQ